MQSQEDKGAARSAGRDPRLERKSEPLAPAVMAGIGAGLGGVVVLVVGLLWWLVVKKLMGVPLVLLILGGVGMLAYVVTNFGRLKSFWGQRSSREFVNSAAFTFFVLGILVLVNVIGARHHYRHDFTQGKEYSLSEQTLKILHGLDKPVRIVAFVSPDYYNAEEIRSRLREYDIASPKTKVTIYDPKTSMDKVKEYGVRYDGTIVVTCADKKEEVTGGSEEQLTSAILSVTKGEKTKVYFLSGHGEKRIDSYGDDSIADVKTNLENQQYAVEELVLLKQKQPAVPGDCAVLCIVGPQQPLADKEISAIKKYLDQAGKLFVALEVPPAPDLHEILEPHGVKPLDGVVFDPVSNLWGNIGIPLVVHPEEHDITRGQESLFFPGARALEVEEEAPEQPEYPGAPPPPPSKKGVELLMTSDSAWLDTNFKPGVQPKRDPGERSGPLCLAVAVDEGKKKPPTPPGVPPAEEGEEKGARLVVVGDSDFMTQNVRNLSPSGVIFALKAIAWLAKEDKLVSIPPKEHKEHRIVLSGAQLKIVIIIIFLIPMLILLAGLGVWLVRRGG